MAAAIWIAKNQATYTGPKIAASLITQIVGMSVNAQVYTMLCSIMATVNKYVVKNYSLEALIAIGLRETFLGAQNVTTALVL